MICNGGIVKKGPSLGKVAIQYWWRHNHTKKSLVHTFLAMEMRQSHPRYYSKHSSYFTSHNWLSMHPVRSPQKILNIVIELWECKYLLQVHKTSNTKFCATMQSLISLPYQLPLSPRQSFLVLYDTFKTKSYLPTFLLISYRETV